MKKNEKTLPKKNPLSLQLDVSKFEKATDDEKYLQQRMRPSTTFFKDGMRRLSKNKIAMTCLILLTLIVLIVIFVPMFYPYSYSAQLGNIKGQLPDSSYRNLKPFEYGESERIKLLGESANVHYLFFPYEITEEIASGDEEVVTKDISKAQKAAAEKFLEDYNNNATADFASNHPENTEFVSNSALTCEFFGRMSKANDWLWEVDLFGKSVRKTGDAQLFDTDEGCYILCYEAHSGNAESVFPHIFGTDDAGRDYAIRVIYGARVSLAVGLFASIIVLIIGVIYGSVSGYYGGKVDIVMMRIVDIIYSLPDLLMIILFSVVLKSVFTREDGSSILEGTPLETLGVGMISIFIVFALLYWVSMARLIRGQILTIKQQDYVLAARSIGASGKHIIIRHMIPNCISVIIISTALQIPSAIFTESFLSFMGLGVDMPMPSLGSLASDALKGINSYSYRLIIPAVAICLIVLSLNLLGDGLRDAFDPKLKK